MTWNDDGDRICAACCTDGAHCVRPADSVGEGRVRNRVTGRDVAESVPYILLEWRPLRIELDIEIAAGLERGDHLLSMSDLPRHGPRNVSRDDAREVLT